MAERISSEPALAPKTLALPSSRDLNEVWETNFDAEFDAMLAAVARGGGPQATLALDTEFPGFPYSDPQIPGHAVNYLDLRRNVDQLWPIQLGVAVVGANGEHRGVWTFNLRFDANVDKHTKESLSFLEKAGIDFERHRVEGVDALALGRRLANSTLVGPHGRAPCWLTFSGSYDWAYLLKLVTMGKPLPATPSNFDTVLSVYCPKRRELRDLLPSGSLEALGRRHGVRRWGAAHTAGSDALLTLELFQQVIGAKAHPTKDGSLWPDWQNSDGWSGFDSPWTYGGNHSVDGAWGNNMWNIHGQTNNDWLTSHGPVSESSGWYATAYPPWFAAL